MDENPYDPPEMETPYPERGVEPPKRNSLAPYIWATLVAVIVAAIIAVWDAISVVLMTYPENFAPK